MENLSSVNIKMNSNVKKDFEDVLGNIGLSVSAAFNIFARQVINDKAIPFQPSTINEKERTLRSMLAIEESSGLLSAQAQEMGIFTQEDVNKFLRNFRKEQSEQLKKRGVK
jgi:DNA-damage-inducible protein J